MTYYGIILENDETVSYKVISKIVADNEKLLDSILVFISNASKSTDGNMFVLNMEEALYEKLVVRDSRLLQDQVFIVNILSNRAENIEFAFNFSPRILKDIYFQMSYTNGRYVEDYSYSLSAISAGIGRKIQFTSGELLLGINFGGKSLSVSSKKLMAAPLYSTVAESVTYLEFMYRSEVLLNWMTFSLGSKYYFSNVSVLAVKTKFNLSLGIGIRFNAI